MGHDIVAMPLSALCQELALGNAVPA